MPSWLGWKQHRGWGIHAQELGELGTGVVVLAQEVLHASLQPVELLFRDGLRHLSCISVV